MDVVGGDLRQRAGNWLLGSEEHPFRRVHHAFMLCALVFFVLAGLINIVLGLTPLWFGAGLAAFGPAVLWMWWRSRWCADFERMSLLFAVSICVAVLPANWVFNGGSAGPTLLFYFVTLIYVIGALETRPRWRRLLVIGLILMPIVLLVLERLQPQWVHAYPSATDRAADLALSYGLAAMLIGVLVHGHSKRFRTELSRATSYAQQLKAVAERDSLTGLHNRRFLELYAKSLSEVIASGETNLAVLLLDLDRFKAVNDTHGHEAGDEVLKAVAGTLVESVRSSDVVVRHGGEEFLVVLPDITAVKAVTVAEKIRKAIAGLRVCVGDVVFRPTVSIGVAHLPGDAADFEAVIRQADSALYQAKEAGRNRVGRAGDGTVVEFRGRAGRA